MTIKDLTKNLLFDKNNTQFIDFFLGKHTGQLKDEVTSPGGTTIRAVQVMERAGIRGIMMDAVQASADRANELGKD